jgi:hypothetical protein
VDTYRGRDMVESGLGHNGLRLNRVKMVVLVISLIMVFPGCSDKKRKTPGGKTVKGKCVLLINRLKTCNPAMVFSRRATQISKKNRTDKLISRCISSSNKKANPKFKCLQKIGCKEFELCLFEMGKKDITKAHKKLQNTYKLKRNTLKMRLPISKKKPNKTGVN